VKETSFQLSDRLALKVDEAAAAIGVSVRHFRSILPAIPHLYLGNRLVIPVEPLKDWLREQTLTEKARADQVAEEVLRDLTID
jgi:hypothetical protein